MRRSLYGLWADLPADIGSTWYILWSVAPVFASESLFFFSLTNRVPGSEYHPATTIGVCFIIFDASAAVVYLCNLDYVWSRVVLVRVRISARYGHTMVK